MKVYKTKEVRNLALVGHSGVGKTNLTESMLYQSGASKEIALVSNKNTSSDYTKEEKERGNSVATSVIPVEWKNKKINIIDTPGDMDFAGELMSALRAAEAALIVVDATSGVQVGTERVWKYCEEIGLPRIIFVNKIDGENVNFRHLTEEMEEKLGKKIIPFSVPIGEGEDFVGVTDVIFQKGFEYNKSQPKETELNHDQVKATERMYEEIAEIVATSDEVLMEKYFSGEKFTRQELLKGVTSALLDGDAVPLLVGSAEKGIGIDILLNTIVNYMPSPDDPRAHTGFRYEEGEEVKLDEKDPFSAYVFKTIVDPYVGKLSIFKVMSGKLKKGMEIYNPRKDEKTKITNLYIMTGNKEDSVDEIYAGDIGATNDFEATETRDTICEEDHKIIYKKTRLPEGNFLKAVEPVSMNDEDKLMSSLRKLQEEDPTIELIRNKETGQLIVACLGSSQFNVLKSKLENLYDVKIQEVDYIIPYRETITKKVEVQGKHKKQSGGAGQYGDVWIRFEPSDEDFVFEEEIFGGAVPKNYFPAVEKGLEESLKRGVLADYPVTGVKATLYDGSYHDVDSNEASFKAAAALAYRNAMPQAGPALLEPVMKMEIRVPEGAMGDVMGDINKRRGRILGMDQEDGGIQIIMAEAPLAELLDYAVNLRAMTQARGDFSMEFTRYEEVPKEVADKVIEKKTK